MVSDRRPFRLATSNTSWRTTSDTATCRTGGTTLDVKERWTLERFTKNLSLRINLPTAIARMDRNWNLNRGLVSARRTERRTRSGRLGTPDCRRHVLPGKKRGQVVGKGYKGTGTDVLILMDGDQTPLGAVIAPANHHETRHIERLLDSSVVELPAQCRLLYDKAADSDDLREKLSLRNVDLIAPHRENRMKPPIQDGRKLRRLKRLRWKVERTNAWLHGYNRFIIRKDRLAMMFLGWTQLACLFTILKRF